MKSRYADIDIVKGIAIVLMVLGHSGVPEGFVRFVYMFHMAVFVIASGYCYSEAYSYGGIRTYIHKKIKTLYMPYVCWMFVLILMHNLLLSWNFYTVSPEFLSGVLGNAYGVESFYSVKEAAVEMLKTLFLLGGEQLFGAAWFIRVLFYSSIVWCVVDNILVKLSRKNLWVGRTVVSLCFLLVGWSMMKYDILNFSNLPNILTAYILLTIGVYMRKLRERYEKKAVYRTLICGMAGSLCILLVFYALQVNVNMVLFDSPGVYLTASLAGWVGLHTGSMLIEKVRGGAVVWCCLGRNTMPIVLFHFVCFKLVTCVEIWVYHLPWFRLASFPIYKGYPAWWILYTLSGVLIPICFSLLFYDRNGRGGLFHAHTLGRIKHDICTGNHTNIK